VADGRSQGGRSSPWQHALTVAALVLIAASFQTGLSCQAQRRFRAIDERLAVIEGRMDKASEAGRSVRVTAEPIRPVRIDIGNSPTKGVVTAPIGMVVYSDFHCQYCGRFARETLPALAKDYIDSGQVRVVFRSLPLDIHPLARAVAAAAMCTARQGLFWDVHDLLFRGLPKDATEARVRELALKAGAVMPLFEKCLGDPDAMSMVEHDIIEAERVGISGTPAFLIGPAEANTVTAVRLIRGAQPVVSFRAELDALLPGVVHTR